MNAPSSSTLQAAVVALDQAQSIRPFDLDMKILLSTEATGGAISVLMGWLKPGEGPPDHYHADRDEMFLLVEGTLELTIGGKTSTAGRGATVFIPRNTVHRFKNVGDAPLCMLEVLSRSLGSTAGASWRSLRTARDASQRRDCEQSTVKAERERQALALHAVVISERVGGE